MDFLKLGPLDQARLADVEEAKHHYLTFILGQADRLAVDGLQREVRRRIAYLKETLRLGGDRQHSDQQASQHDAVGMFHAWSSLSSASILPRRKNHGQLRQTSPRFCK